MIIECTNLSKEYIAPDGQTVIPVLRDINVSVKKGESVAILGPSGSGKSTLLHLLGLLDYPTGGSIIFHEKEVAGLPEKERDWIRNRMIGFVFQLHYLLPQCTVIENVLIPALPKANSSLSRAKPATATGKQDAAGSIEDRALELLRRVGLASRLYHRPWQLSGGELQRVAFVRALINSPLLVLADEPTGSLDGRTSHTLIQLLLELNREEGVTLMVVTHSPALASHMDRVYILENGTLSQQ
jgi:lipoprotein-releasing system ATP-binding protein